MILLHKMCARRDDKNVLQFIRDKDRREMALWGAQPLSGLPYSIESCCAGFFACGGTHKRRISIPPQCNPAWKAFKFVMGQMLRTSYSCICRKHSHSGLSTFMFMFSYPSNVCTSVHTSMHICTAAVRITITKNRLFLKRKRRRKLTRYHSYSYKMYALITDTDLKSLISSCCNGQAPAMPTAFCALSLSVFTAVMIYTCNYRRAS